MTPLCLSVAEAAKSLGVSVWVLRRWIDDGLLPTVKFPSANDASQPNRRVLIAVRDLEAFVNAHREGER